MCSYDRAYDGFSDAGPIPVTMHQQVDELHKLLKAGQLRPPYIMVGHSYGGILARLYKSIYPSEVTGLVFVDATHEDIHLGAGMFRETAKGTPVPPPQSMQTSPPLPFTPEEQKLVDRRTKQLQQESQQAANSLSTACHLNHSASIDGHTLTQSFPPLQRGSWRPGFPKSSNKYTMKEQGKSIRWAICQLWSWVLAVRIRGTLRHGRRSSTIWPAYPGTAGWLSMNKAVIIFSGTIRR